jgi:chromosome segregation ATPase
MQVKQELHKAFDQLEQEQSDLERVQREREEMSRQLESMTKKIAAIGERRYMKNSCHFILTSFFQVLLVTVNRR